MSITFRIEDDAETDNLRPVMIDPLQMGALRETLARLPRSNRDWIFY